MARSTNEKLTLFRELGQVLLDDDIEDSDVRAVSFERVPKKVLQEAIDETQGLIRPRPDDAEVSLIVRKAIEAYLDTGTHHSTDDCALRVAQRCEPSTQDTLVRTAERLHLPLVEVLASLLLLRSKEG